MVKWLREQGVDFFLISVFFLYLGYASSWVIDDVFTSIIFAIIFVIFWLKRQKIDRILYITLIVWLGINFISTLFINTHQSFSYITLIGVTLRIVMPYLIVKIIGITFYDKIIKYAYYLSIIGLIFFAVQLFDPNLFYSLAPFLNFMTQQEQYESGGWYIFVYMFSSWAPDRNSGFAWEPGAYACILIILLAIHLAKQNFKLDKISIIFIISIITTLSTSGYLALFLIFIAYLIKHNNKIINPFYIIGTLLIMVFSINFYRTSDFMEKKINTYIEEEDIEYMHFTGVLRINRVEEFNRAIDQSLNWPFGNGILDSDYRIKKYGYAIGPNSLATIIMQWGWLGIYFFIFTTTGIFYFYSKKIVISVLLTTAFCMTLFSNPFMMRYLVFASFFYYYLYLKRSIKSLTISESLISPVK